MSPAENKAVFLSYASQDADAARRVCDALRAAGVEVWFDQSELRGGDAWDQKIRKQIKECALFMPVISANTDARPEGYFRLEWLLAVERARLMADDHPFLFPTTIGDVHEGSARVPEKFRAVQWTPLRDDAALEPFARWIRQVLHSPASAPSGRGVTRPPEAPQDAHPVPVQPPARRWRWLAAAAAIVTAVALTFVLRRPPPPPPAEPEPAPATLAVLPFMIARTNPSDVELAETLHDEVISALARIRALRVLSRDAVQSYGEASRRNPPTIAQRLRASAFIEVALRRLGTRLEVNARLLRAPAGTQEWAEVFHAEAGTPQERAALAGLLARKTAAALHVTPTGAENATLGRTLTRDAEAYALYQRVRLSKVESEGRLPLKDEEQIKLLRAALARDPNFAAAYVELVVVHSRMYWFSTRDPSPARKNLAKEALDHAIRLAPNDPVTRFARGLYLYRCERDYRRALEAFDEAEPGMPGDAELRRWIALTLRRLGRDKEALAAADAALALEPNNISLLEHLVETCFQFRRFDAVLDYGRRYFELAPRGWMRRHVARAAYELSGDKAELERALFPPDDNASRRGDPRALYGVAWLRGDWAEAARLLDEPRLWPELVLTRVSPSLRGLDSALPVHRAYVSLARGDPETAKVHANEALKRLAVEVQSEREGYIIRVAIAEMTAVAGQGEAAVAAMKKVLAELTERDAFEGLKHQHRLACVYAAAGMPREALDQLARLMQRPCDATPSELREEPMLASLRALPELERILTSARKL